MDINQAFTSHSPAIMLFPPMNPEATSLPAQRRAHAAGRGAESGANASRHAGARCFVGSRFSMADNVTSIIIVNNYEIVIFLFLWNFESLYSCILSSHIHGLYDYAAYAGCLSISVGEEFMSRFLFVLGEQVDHPIVSISSLTRPENPAEK